MSADIWWSIGLVFLFIIIGGIFAGTEIALVSLRPSQVDQLAKKGKRGERTAAIARDPNRFLAAVQIGVTVAGFFSAAYGASAIAPALVPLLTSWGMNTSVANTVALIFMTLLIAYFSLVLGELVPKRIGLQRSTTVALATAPTLGSFSTLMRPVIAVLSASTNAVVRLFGGDPDKTGEEMDEAELREVVTGHEGLDADERGILADVFAAGDHTLAEVMQPRHAVAFLDSDQTVEDALAVVSAQPYSRYPVRDGSIDNIMGFVHVRDVWEAAFRNRGGEPIHIRDLVRDIVVLPGSNRLLPTITTMRDQRVHIGLVIDEYGGTDGIVTLEDLVEELVGDIQDEYDEDDSEVTSESKRGPWLVPGVLTFEDVADVTRMMLPEGPYETIGGYVMDNLDRVAEVGDTVVAIVEDESWTLEVTQTDGNRIVEVRVQPTPDGDGRVAPPDATKKDDSRL